MEALTQLLSQAQRLVLLSHIHPDGDAISSLTALSLGLQSLGKQVEIVLPDGYPPIFSFLPTIAYSEQFPSNPAVDLVVIVDASDVSRTNFVKELKPFIEQGKLVFIDHHPKGDLARLSVACLHKEDVSSTAELIYQVLTTLSVRLTPAMATSLLTGIYTDTGGFQYANTSTRTLELAAELMKRGARLDTISHAISQSKTVAGLKLLGLALEHIRLVQGGKLVISVLTQEDLQHCQAGAEDVAGIIGELNVLPGVEIALLLVEIEPGVIRGSLRTGEGYKTKVNGLAKLLGGAGHPRAAGFILAGHIVLDPAKENWRVEAPEPKSVTLKSGMK